VCEWHAFEGVRARGGPTTVASSCKKRAVKHGGKGYINNR